MSSEYLTLCIRKDTKRIVYVDSQGNLSDNAKDGAEIRVILSRPYNVKVSRMVTGSVEEWNHEIGFFDEESRPKDVMASFLLNVEKKALKLHEVTIGGPIMNISFPLSVFLGKEGWGAGDPNTLLKMTEDPADIVFVLNSHTPVGLPMHER